MQHCNAEIDDLIHGTHILSQIAQICKAYGTIGQSDKSFGPSRNHFVDLTLVGIPHLFKW